MDNDILQEAVRTYNTSCHIFDLDASIPCIRRMEQLPGKQVNIYYIMKANPFLTVVAVRVAGGLEVCSPGEYDICCCARAPTQKIVLSGVNKEETHIRWAMAEQGADTYTVESLNQLSLLETCAVAAGRTGTRVLVRLTSDNQFGMDEEDILASIRSRGYYPHLDLADLQYYSGTQKRRMEKIKEELEKLDSFLVFVREHMDSEFREPEYGPGFQIPYFERQEQTDEETLLQEFKKVLNSLSSKGITFPEAGRFLAAPRGSYLTRVADAKRCQRQNYCVAGGGINHVNYYGRTMTTRVLAYRYLSQDNPTWPLMPQTSDDWQTTCGSLRTSGDILIKNLPLEGLMTGDLLVFDRIGAYSVTEGIYLFLSRQLPVAPTCTLKQGLSLVWDAFPMDTLNDGSAMELHQTQIGFQGYGDNT